MFVTTIVVGAVAIAADTRVDRAAFLRDVLAYIVAVAYLFFVFEDNRVTLLEALGFNLIYVAFAGCVGSLLMDRLFGRVPAHARPPRPPPPTPLTPALSTATDRPASW